MKDICRRLPWMLLVLHRGFADSDTTRTLCSWRRIIPSPNLLNYWKRRRRTAPTAWCLWINAGLGLSCHHRDALQIAATSPSPPQPPLLLSVTPAGMGVSLYRAKKPLHDKAVFLAFCKLSVRPPCLICLSAGNSRSYQVARGDALLYTLVPGIYNMHGKLASRSASPSLREAPLGPPLL